MSNATALPVDRCAGEPAAAPIVQILPALHTDLGGLPIRRLLPRSQRRMVGPWCFFDLYGPLPLDGARPMDVPPHPHIGLQTVSWLLAGEIVHDDSLGLRATVRPGGLNLMTSGRGIAHAERTPPGASGSLHGVQLWVALPEAHRRVEPSFDHHPAVPAVQLDGGRAFVIMGELAGQRSPARTFSPIVAADVEGPAGARVLVPVDPGFEHCLVVLAGGWEIDGARLDADTLYYVGTGRRALSLRSHADGSRLLLLGGAPFGETILMWWNFVARTSEEMQASREDWEAGRFGEVTAYPGRRLAAPPFVARPVPPSTR